MDITSPSWIFMALPLMGLAINLFWPRRRDIKTVCLVLLLLASYMHIVIGLSALERSVGLAEHISSREQTPTLERLVQELHFARGIVKLTFFDVAVCLTLGVVLAATPVDIITRFRTHRITERKADDQSPNA